MKTGELVKDFDAVKQYYCEHCGSRLDIVGLSCNLCGHVNEE